MTRVLDCDVLVAGSGAAGFAAAITAAHHGLRVVLAEKAPVFGGTTAWSGGWLWVPMNPLARAAGIEEPVEGPMEYLRHELGNRAGDPRIPVFLRNGPEMVAFFAEHSAVEWIDGNHMPDFHESPGRLHGGRSVSVRPYDARGLGADVARLRPPLDVVSLGGMGIAGGTDMAHFFHATRRPASAAHVLRRLMRHGRDLAVHRRGMHLVNGNALIARLMRSAIDKGVTLMENAALTELTTAGGRVTGAHLATPRGKVLVRTVRGVVLATGGYPHDAGRIAATVDHGATGHFSAAVPTDTGDGMRAAEGAGAGVAGNLAAPMAWAPVSLVPRADGTQARFPHLVERAKPGIIAVDTAGRRFVNEADSYHDFIRALLSVTPPGQAPVAWLIADRRAQRRWGLGHSRPFPFPLRGALRSGYLKQGRTLADLARACGLPADALTATVARFNAAAARGEDPDFHRGMSRYNQVQGDLAHAPNPSLAPLERGPFYAVRIVPGSLGSFAGLCTDAAARVLDRAGAPIPGLMAVGNDMTSIFGGHYPSGGITLGPGMTFGYIAGRILAGLPVAGLDDAAVVQEGETA